MASTLSPLPACLTPDNQIGSRKAYRHNPYAYSLLNERDRHSAATSFVELYKGILADGQGQVQRKVHGVASTASPATVTLSSSSSSAGKYDSACPSPAPEEAEALAHAKCAGDSGNDDGVSETSSDAGSGERSHGATLTRTTTTTTTASKEKEEALVGFSVTGSHHLPLSVAASSAASVAAPSVIRYASVNFRFGSAWFVAPFRTFVGDMVVVQYPGNNNSLHMGLVSSITTAKPITFYTEDNMDSNYLSAEELETVPRLLRHARDFDKETKLDLRSHDLRSLANARALAEELGAAIQFLDAEWLLDLSAVTFLVKVYGSAELADQLVDELAMQEGAEVVFTYPVSSSMY